jgi:hypothetical protein
MIVRKTWQKRSQGGLVQYEYDGWFLFGFIPLYVRRYGF